jgi:DNA-binding protein HU-beta
MNKMELIETVATKTAMGKAEAEKIVGAVIDIVTEELKKGGEVTLTGFGSFSVSNRAARTGVNPQNPTQKIQIAATKVPKFKAGKGLKDAVRGS